MLGLNQEFKAPKTNKRVAKMLNGIISKHTRVKKLPVITIVVRHHAVRSVAAADQSPLAETNDGVVANYRPPISSNRHNVIRDDGNRPRKINARLRGAPCKTPPPPSSRARASKAQQNY